MTVFRSKEWPREGCEYRDGIVTLGDPDGAPDRTWYPNDADAERLAVALIQATPGEVLKWPDWPTLDVRGGEANVADVIKENPDPVALIRFALALVRAARKP